MEKRRQRPKTRPKQKPLGAKVFALLRRFKIELARRDAKDAWQLRTAQLEDVERVAENLRKLRDKEAKPFLESPKFRHATQARLKRARAKLSPSKRSLAKLPWWQRKGRFLGERYLRQKTFST